MTTDKKNIKTREVTLDEYEKKFGCFPWIKISCIGFEAASDVHKI